MNKYEKEAGEYADKASFRVPFDGSNKFYDDNHFKWAKTAYLAACQAREKEMQEKDRRIGELEQWKKEAMEAMPDYQKIGKLLGVSLGESVHDKIVPGIEKLRDALDLAIQLAVGLSWKDVPDILVGVTNDEVLLRLKQARAALSGNGEEGGGDAIDVDVLRFAEWIHINKLSCYNTPNGMMWKTAGYSDKTTQELYNLYKQSKH